MFDSKTPDWNRLDNAAKIFPPSSNKRDTKVFRFSCVLTESVLQPLLQAAVEQALDDFPFYRSILKQGLFWHYFEQSELKASVYEENEPPCAPLYDINSHSLLFQVTYYQNRINLEIYHALTDGTGALEFLRTIVYYYLTSRYQKQLPALDYDASSSQKAEDSFQKFYVKRPVSSRQKIVSYQIKSTLLPEGRLRVIEGICSTKALLELAHRHNTTLTIYLTAVLLCSISETMSMRDKKKPVYVCVPVNLRNYFQSVTARNFFSVINVGYHFGSEPPIFEDVLKKVRESFEQQLTKEQMSVRLSKLMAIEKNPFVRIVPLFLKKFVLKIAHNQNRKEGTVSFSNVGRIKMPEQLAPFIDHFEVYVSTTRVQACSCSFGDRFSISFTSPFLNTEIQKRFFRTLTYAGVPVEIVSNLIADETKKPEHLKKG